MNRNVAFSLLVIAIVVSVVRGVSIGHPFETDSNNTQNCVCRNWRYCDGEINSDVQCHPSYVMVCCIEPKVVPKDESLIQVIQIP